jgi:hypothetical protein
MHDVVGELKVLSKDLETDFIGPFCKTQGYDGKAGMIEEFKGKDLVRRLKKVSENEELKSLFGKLDSRRKVLDEMKEIAEDLKYGGNLEVPVFSKFSVTDLSQAGDDLTDILTDLTKFFCIMKGEEQGSKLRLPERVLMETTKYLAIRNFVAMVNRLEKRLTQDPREFDKAIEEKYEALKILPVKVEENEVLEFAKPVEPPRSRPDRSGMDDLRKKNDMLERGLIRAEKENARLIEENDKLREERDKYREACEKLLVIAEKSRFELEKIQDGVLKG